MGVSADAYGRLLAHLLPSGAAWQPEDGSKLAALVRGLAEELARIHGRGDALIEEADPRTTLELLADWERALGLPDDCTPPPVSTADRRVAIIQRLTGQGGQSRQFFIALGAALGYQVTIDEYGAFTTLSTVDETVTGPNWQFAWRANIEASIDEADVFTTRSTVDDRLASWGALDIECLYNELKPSHTVVLFAYA